jgi:hypothetical protein
VARGQIPGKNPSFTCGGVTKALAFPGMVARERVKVATLGVFSAPASALAMSPLPTLPREGGSRLIPGKKGFNRKLLG